MASDTAFCEEHPDLNPNEYIGLTVCDDGCGMNRETLVKLFEPFLSDVILPELNGQELGEKRVSIYPELKVLLMSGYTEDVIARQGVLDEGINFIQKPFSKDALATMVRVVLDNNQVMEV